jgi:hypothetical protein
MIRAASHTIQGRIQPLNGARRRPPNNVTNIAEWVVESRGGATARRAAALRALDCHNPSAIVGRTMALVLTNGFGLLRHFIGASIAYGAGRCRMCESADYRIITLCYSRMGANGRSRQ